jgi:ORF6N domain
MLDADLAALYGVQTKVLVQVVKRNLPRFPEDFMFQLSGEEWADLRSQFVTSSSGHGGRRTAPYAFTEQGVAMLSSVLGSERAIAVNIEIMRAFVRLRDLLVNNKELARRFADLEKRLERKLATHDQPIASILDADIPLFKLSGWAASVLAVSISNYSHFIHFSACIKGLYLRLSLPIGAQKLMSFRTEN